jgi:hypothetical protein
MQQLLQAGGAALVAKRLTGKKQSHYVTSVTLFRHAPKRNRAHRSFTSKKAEQQWRQSISLFGITKFLGFVRLRNSKN